MKKKAEILLIGSFALVGVLLGIWLLFTQQPGTMVEIRVSGQTTQRFSLLENREYEIQGVGGHNLLVIENGEAWIEDADCPDALCSGMGRISMAGQSVVCLPHEMVVEIIGESTGAEAVDSVAG